MFVKPGSNDKATRRSSGTRKASSAAGAAAAGSGVYEVYFNIGSVEAFERKLEEAQYELRVPEGMLFFFVCVSWDCWLVVSLLTSFFCSPATLRRRLCADQVCDRE